MYKSTFIFPALKHSATNPAGQETVIIIKAISLWIKTKTNSSFPFSFWTSGLVLFYISTHLHTSLSLCFFFFFDFLCEELLEGGKDKRDEEKTEPFQTSSRKQNAPIIETGQTRSNIHASTRPRMTYYRIMLKLRETQRPGQSMFQQWQRLVHASSPQFKNKNVKDWVKGLIWANKVQLTQTGS